MIKQISAHSEIVEKVIEAMGTSIETGLSEAEAQFRLEKYGKNELTKEKGKTAFQIFIGQFKSFLVYLLLFAIAISIIIGIWEGSQLGAEEWSAEYTDAIVIASILIANAILGFYQEYQAERSMESLKKLAPHFAKVRREGIISEKRNQSYYLVHRRDFCRYIAVFFQG